MQQDTPLVGLGVSEGGKVRARTQVWVSKFPTNPFRTHWQEERGQT